MRRNLVAEILVNSQPSPILRRLAADEAFTAQLGLSPKATLRLGGAGSFDATRLWRAVRAALEEAKPQTLIDSDGAVVTLTAEGESLQFQREPEGLIHRVVHPVFRLLGPAAARRSRAFEQLRAMLGPTAPRFDDLASRLGQGRPTEREFMAIFEEVATGVASQQQRIVTGITVESRLSLSDLVPDRLLFFERCFGPDPGSAPPEAYLATTLPAFRRELLARDLAGGLSVCLPGFLRDDLTLIPLVGDRSDEVLWQALQGISPLADPFSALGALDLAISRSENDLRFRSLAENAVQRLTAERFDGPVGTDHYQLLPPLVLAIEDFLSELEGAMARPPFWRRLCAFAHAAWLSQRFPIPDTQAREFCAWLKGQHTSPGRTREVLDLRLEPMWITSNLSASDLRAEIIGRLALLVERHRREGHEIPATERVSAAIEREDKSPSPLARLRPGPLEGHRRPAASEGGHPLPKDTAQELLAHLSPELVV